MFICQSLHGVTICSPVNHCMEWLYVHLSIIAWSDYMFCAIMAIYSTILHKLNILKIQHSWLAENVGQTSNFKTSETNKIGNTDNRIKNFLHSLIKIIDSTTSDAPKYSDWFHMLLHGIWNSSLNPVKSVHIGLTVLLLWCLQHYYIVYAVVNRGTFCYVIQSETTLQRVK